MKFHLYLWMLLFFFKSVTLSAQSCDSMPVCDCAAKDLNPAAMMLGHEHGKGTWKFSYRYMNVMMQHNLSGAQTVDDNYVFNNYIMSPQRMRMDMHMLMAMYGINDRFSVMLMFNYNSMSMSMNMLPGTMQMNGSVMTVTEAGSNTIHSKTSGPGDTKLYLVYTILNHNMHHLFLHLGFNIPTGSIQKKGTDTDVTYAGERLPYMMQTGSGSLDLMPGLSYLFKTNNTSFGTQVTSVMHPFNNSLNYHLGNEFTINVWLAHKWLSWISTSVRLESNTVGAITGYDPSLVQNMEPDANPLCYGGQTIAAYAGINFYLNKGVLKNNRLAIEYGMPLYQNLNGPQLSFKSTLSAGWLISF